MVLPSVNEALGASSRGGGRIFLPRRRRDESLSARFARSLAFAAPTCRACVQPSEIGDLERAAIPLSRSSLRCLPDIKRRPIIARAARGCTRSKSERSPPLATRVQLQRRSTQVEQWKTLGLRRDPMQRAIDGIRIFDCRGSER